MSDDKKNSKDWNSLSAETLESYETKEFEEARTISGEDDFTEFDVSSSDESFQPLVENQDFDGFEDKQPEPPSEEKKSSMDEKSSLKGDKAKKKGKDSKIDALSAVVDQEKEDAYNKGLEDGKLQGKEDARADIEKANEELREEKKAEGFEEGKINGYEAGKQEAYDEVRKEFGQKAKSVLKILESIESSWDKVLEKYEDEIVELSLNIARRVLYSNLTLDPDFVKLSIKEALNEIPDPVDVTIGVNPEDYNIIEMIKEDFFQRFENLKNITIVSDPAIGRGGCTIDSESGGITQTVENRLNILEEQLLKNGLKKTGR
ncbi:MAG: FliH/SctL family protein [Thermodesulfobacteriota bacterium]